MVQELFGYETKIRPAYQLVTHFSKRVDHPVLPGRYYLLTACGLQVAPSELKNGLVPQPCGACLRALKEKAT